MAKTTKLGRMVTYLNGLLLLKSHNAFITWSCEITWQTETIMSPIPQCVWKPNLVTTCLQWLLLTIKSYNTLFTWSRTVTWKTKTIASPRNLGDGELLREAPAHKVPWHFNQVVLQGHVTHSVLYISICSRSIGTKHDNVATHCEALPHINSHNSLSMCSHEVTQQI